MIQILLTLGAAAVSYSGNLQVVASSTTPKSAEVFGRCFIKTQQRAARPWWFVPHEDGGTFSNLGAKDGNQTYFVRLHEQPHIGVMQITVESSASDQQAIRAAVSQCA